MQYKSDINTELEVAVPEVIRANLLRRGRAGITSIKIENESSKAKDSWSEVNVIQIAKRGRKDADDEISLDDLALAVVLVMHNHWLSRNESDEYNSSYKITVNTRDKGNAYTYARNYFYYRYRPGEVDAEAERIEEFQNEWLQQSMETLRNQNDNLVTQNQQLHEVVLEHNKLAAGPLTACVEMFHTAISIFSSGADMIIKAKQAEYSTESIKMEQQGKDRRQAEWIKQFGPFMKIISQQGAIYAVKKVMGDQAAEQVKNQVDQENAAEEAEAHGGDAATGGGEAPSAAPTPSQATADDMQAPEHPAAFLCESFAMNLTPAQRREMNKVLTKAEVEVIDNLFCARTDDEAMDGWIAAKKLKPEKLAQFAMLMNSDQMEDFKRIQAFMDQCVAARDETRKKGKS